MVTVEPVVFNGLTEEFGSGIRRRQRHLHGVGVDVDSKVDGLLQGLAGLTGKTHNEGAVDRYTEVVAILSEASRHVHSGSLLDVIEDLLVPALIAYEQEPQAVVLKNL